MEQTLKLQGQASMEELRKRLRPYPSQAYLKHKTLQLTLPGSEIKAMIAALRTFGTQSTEWLLPRS
jgi:hypothetical protein